MNTQRATNKNGPTANFFETDFNNKTNIVTAKINKVDNNMNVIYKCTKLNKTFLQ